MIQKSDMGVIQHRNFRTIEKDDQAGHQNSRNPVAASPIQWRVWNGKALCMPTQGVVAQFHDVEGSMQASSKRTMDACFLRLVTHPFFFQKYTATEPRLENMEIRDSDRRWESSTVLRIHMEIVTRLGLDQSPRTRKFTRRLRRAQISTNRREEGFVILLIDSEDWAHIIGC